MVTVVSHPPAVCVRPVTPRQSPHPPHTPHSFIHPSIPEMNDTQELLLSSPVTKQACNWPVCTCIPCSDWTRGCDWVRLGCQKSSQRKMKKCLTADEVREETGSVPWNETRDKWGVCDLVSRGGHFLTFYCCSFHVI